MKIHTACSHVASILKGVIYDLWKLLCEGSSIYSSQKMRNIGENTNMSGAQMFYGKSCTMNHFELEKAFETWNEVYIVKYRRCSAYDFHFSGSFQTKHH